MLTTDLVECHGTARWKYSRGLLHVGMEVAPDHQVGAMVLGPESSIYTRPSLRRALRIDEAGKTYLCSVPHCPECWRRKSWMRLTVYRLAQALISHSSESARQAISKVRGATIDAKPYAAPCSLVCPILVFVLLLPTERSITEISGACKPSLATRWFECVDDKDSGDCWL
jgi:hypothetical protein